ncbi:hypothetical protein CC117_25215 [Parafrankia colletiae]|uniref:Glycosyltransferase RgtA/B/C/D-like domain-containing protein n=2 Tax=Parafrankia colletiae TaxID=573497 RepID=A0A1S1QG23_9ACTN|nr:hypothetical protein CC117_25215 [Parafrankia colletiae]
MRLRPLRLLRSVPLPIWLITALFGALLASWSVLVPQYHAPDEPNQVDAVMRLVQGAGWPHPGHAFVRPDGVGAIAASPYGSAAVPYELDFAPIDEAGATARDDRPTWDELGDTRQANGEVQPPGDIQQLVQHPPLYYLVGAAALWALPGDGDGLRWDVTIGTLRLLSALMVMWLPLLAWAGAHRLSGGNRIAATCAALLPLAVPQLSHIGSSVNNDNLLVLTAGLATVTIIYVLRGDTSPRTAALAGLFIGLALLSKSLGIVLVPMAVLAYLVAWRRARQDAAAGGRSVATGADRDAPFLLSDTGLLTVPADATRFPWRQLLLGGTVMVAAGGWWWIVNIVRYRTFQPETPGFPLGDDLDGDWASYLDVLVNGAARRWWGSFGWFETNLPMEVVGAASVVVIVLFALALVRGRDGRARVNLLFLLWPTLGLFGLMTLQATMAFTDHGHVSGISGRYLYGGMTALAIGVGLGASTFGRNVARVFPVLFLVAAAAIQWWSVRSVLRHFWKPVGGNLSDAWEAMTAWSPWPPSAMVATMWTGAGLAVAVLVACVWIAVLGDGQDRPGPTTFRDPSGWPPGPDIWVPGRLTVEDPAEQHISRPAREAHPETAPETVLETAPKVHRGATEPAPAERSGTDSVPSGSTAPESAPSRSAPDEHGSSSPFRSGPPGANSAPSTAKGRPPSTTSPVPSH